MQPSRESSAIRYYCFLSTLASARIHLLNRESTDESKRLADGLPKKDVYDSFRASPFNSSARPFGSVHSPNILRSPSIVGYSLSPEHNSPITFIYTLLKRNSNSPVEKVHANLQTNDNWTTPFSLPFLPNSSRDICWNLATVKILIFSGAHHRSTTIHSIVCHRLKNDPVRPFPENLSWTKYWEIHTGRITIGNCVPSPNEISPREERAFRNRRIPLSARTPLPVFIVHGELWKLLGPRKPDRNKPANSVYSVYYEFYDYV